MLLNIFNQRKHQEKMKQIYTSWGNMNYTAMSPDECLNRGEQAT